MADLFATAALPRPAAPQLLHQETPALAALALAFGHDHVLSFPRRNPEGEWRTPPPPAEDWLRGYAESRGLHQARRFHLALQRLSREHREALAAELLGGASDG